MCTHKYPNETVLYYVASYRSASCIIRRALYTDREAAL